MSRRKPSVLQNLVKNVSFLPMWSAPNPLHRKTTKT
jgi:hypothetical protein